jgi:hypothetical protein
VNVVLQMTCALRAAPVIGMKSLSPVTTTLGRRRILSLARLDAVPRSRNLAISNVTAPDEAHELALADTQVELSGQPVVAGGEPGEA